MGGAGHGVSGRKSFPDSGNSPCKGPEVGACRCVQGTERRAVRLEQSEGGERVSSEVRRRHGGHRLLALTVRTWLLFGMSWEPGEGSERRRDVSDRGG